MKEKELKKLLVMRFSAMGDVAMTVPVLTLLARQHPELRITVMTRRRFVPMYEWVPANVDVMGIELSDYEGLGGLTRLYNQLRKQGYDAIADLHDVLRTKYLRTCFRMAGKPVAVIDKGRKAKHAIIGHGVDADPLPLMTDRYARVFSQLGLDIDMTQCKSRLFDLSGEPAAELDAIVGRKAQGQRWIGIAPFAAHDMKVYPLDRMHRVADMLAEQGCRVFLFGAGSAEGAELAGWEREGVISTVVKLGGLRNELMLISRLDLMVSMDSANMHMAAMMGTQTLSVWGPTHPKAGFTGWAQRPESIIGVDDLPCRPCSIYGNKPCKLGDHRCMTGIDAERIVNTINRRHE